MEVSNIFAIYSGKSTATAHSFYGDPVQSYLLLLIFGWLWTSIYIYIYIERERERERDDFLRDDKYIYTYIICMLTDANLGKLNVNLIIIGWVCSKMTETF